MVIRPVCRQRRNLCWKLLGTSSGDEFVHAFLISTPQYSISKSLQRRLARYCRLWEEQTTARSSIKSTFTFSAQIHPPLFPPTSTRTRARRRNIPPVVPPTSPHPCPLPTDTRPRTRTHPRRRTPSSIFGSIIPHPSHALYAHTLVPSPSPVIFCAAPAYPAHKPPRYVVKEPTQAAYTSPSTSQGLLADGTTEVIVAAGVSPVAYSRPPLQHRDQRRGAQPHFPHAPHGRTQVLCKTQPMTRATERGMRGRLPPVHRCHLHILIEPTHTPTIISDGCAMCIAFRVSRWVATLERYVLT